MTPRRRFVTDLSALAGRLRGSLGRTLPGWRAQERMSPRPGVDRTPAGSDHVAAAALLLLYPAPGGPGVLLTVRSPHLPQHRGQVSLPGGVIEPGESTIEGALREAREEVALPPEEVDVAGELSPLAIPVSGYVVHPVLGFADALPPLTPNPGEVARILEVPLAELADPARLRVERWRFKGGEREVPFFDVEGETVWGATAMILAELLWLLDAAPDPWSMDGPPPPS